MDDQTSSKGSVSASLPTLALPTPPPDTATATGSTRPSTLDVSANTTNTTQTITLEELGPMVVNSDGTLSRIANWTHMTDAERQRTLRVLSARNKLRLANEEKKQREGEGQGGAAASGQSTLPFQHDSVTSSTSTPRPTSY